MVLEKSIVRQRRHTMFARILPLSRAMAALVVDDVLRGGPAAAQITQFDGKFCFHSWEVAHVCFDLQTKGNRFLQAGMM